MRFLSNRAFLVAIPAEVVVLYLLVVSVALANAHAQPPEKHLVVYDISFDEVERQDRALRNIDNHLELVGPPNLDLQVVVRGRGVTLLQRANSDNLLRIKLASFKGRGVQIKVCGQSLKMYGIEDPSKLYGVTTNDVVRLGVDELAKLQQKGYVYIKP